MFDLEAQVDGEHITVRKLAGAIKQATAQPVSISTLQHLMRSVITRLDEIETDGGEEGWDTAIELCRFGSAIVGARYIGRNLPHVAAIHIQTGGEQADAQGVEFVLASYGTDGKIIELTDPEKHLIVELVSHHLFSDFTELLPEPGNPTLLDLAALRRDYPEHDDDFDLIFRMDLLPTDVSPQDVDDAIQDGPTAVTLITETLRRLHISPIPDEVLWTASAELARKCEQSPSPRNMELGFVCNGVLFARRLREEFPEVHAFEFAVQDSGDGGEFHFVMRDANDDQIEAEEDDLEIVRAMTHLLYPDVVFWQEMASAPHGYRIIIDDTLNHIPAPEPGI